MLKHLEVNNFKSLVGFKVDFGSTSVIVGNNAVGKSTVLQAIEFFFGAVKEDFGIMLERHSWNVSNVKSKLISSPKMSFSCDIDLETEGKVHSYHWSMSLEVKVGDDELKLLSESVDMDGNQLFEYSAKSNIYSAVTDDGNEQIIIPLVFTSSVMKQIGRNYSGEDLRQFIAYIENFDSFEMLSPGAMRLSSRGSGTTIGMSGQNLPSFIRQMNQEEKNRFGNKLRNLLDNKVSDIEAETKGKPGWTQIRITENYGDKKISFNSKEMSDGMLRMLAFVAISEIRKPDAVMLLDEVENGINISYAEKLMNIFRSMYQDNRHQIIMTTHSTVFLDYVEPENIIYLYRDHDGATKAVSLFRNEEMKKKLDYMWPGEVLLNMSQSEIVENILRNEENPDLVVNEEKSE